MLLIKVDIKYVITIMMIVMKKKQPPIKATTFN